MRDQSVAQFGFKPGRFRRHDLSGISDCHELLHCDRRHGKSNCIFAGVDQFFQFSSSSDAADEVDVFAGARIIYAEEGGKDELLQIADIQTADNSEGSDVEFGNGAFPDSGEVKLEFARLCDTCGIGSGDFKLLTQLGDEFRVVKSLNGISYCGLCHRLTPSSG